MMILIPILVFIGYFGLLFGIELLSYVLQGVAIVKLSKKMGVPCSWQAFLPVFAEYRCGKLAEKACLLENPEKKPFRFGAFMAGGYAGFYGITLLSTAASLLLGAVILVLVLAATAMESAGDEAAAFGALLLLVVLFLYMILIGVSSLFSSITPMLTYALLFLDYFVLYKIYKVFTKENAVWLMLLSIFVPLGSTVILLVLAFGEKYKIEGVDDQKVMDGEPAVGEVAQA